MGEICPREESGDGKLQGVAQISQRYREGVFMLRNGSLIGTKNLGLYPIAALQLLPNSLSAPASLCELTAGKSNTNMPSCPAQRAFFCNEPHFHSCPQHPHLPVTNRLAVPKCSSALNQFCSFAGRKAEPITLLFSYLCFTHPFIIQAS